MPLPPPALPRVKGSAPASSCSKQPSIRLSIMHRSILPICLISAIIGGASPATAQAQPQAGRDRLASYADVADLALASPVVVRATIIAARTLPRNAASTVAADRARVMVTAQVTNLLVAPGATTATLMWLWDAPADARGRPPKAKGLDVLAFVAAPDANGGTRLMSRRGQQNWDPALADRVKQVVAEARGGTVPEFRGVTNGFRADGTISGESESQFFLATNDGKPATLVVQKRPAEMLRVLVARGDIIDDSAQRVQPGSLLWYRLACGLPAHLPAAAGGSSTALARDWTDAMTSLGPCGRTN